MSTATQTPKNSGIDNLARTAKDEKLSLDQIWMETQNNAREAYPDEEMEELRNSIEAAGGIMQPLQVIPVEPSEQTENKPYCLVSGFRRYMCLEQLAESDPSMGQNVPCRILDISTQGGYKLTQLMENMARSDLNPVEQAIGLKEILTASGNTLTAEEVARMIGMSPGRASQLLKMLELPKEILEAVSSGEISFSHARVLSYDVPASAQLDMLKLAKTEVFGEFKKAVDKKYHSAGNAETSSETTDETGKSSQKAAQMIRADRIKGTYAKIAEEQAAKAQDPDTKKYWEIVKDAFDFVLRKPDTKIGELIKPFEEKLEADEEADKLKKDAGTKLQHFYKAAINRLRKYRNIMPADGEVRPTLNQDMAKVLQEAKAEIEASKTDPAKAKALGFTVATLLGVEEAAADAAYDDKLAQGLAEAWQADTKDREEKAKKREEEKAAKKAEEDAKKAAEEKAKAEAAPVQG